MQILVDRSEYKQLQEELSRRDDLKERIAELKQINEQLRWELATYQQIKHISSQEGIRLHDAVGSLEKWLIANVLEQHHWHRGKTAESLGIPRRSLQRKMKKYGMM